MLGCHFKPIEKKKEEIMKDFYIRRYNAVKHIPELKRQTLIILEEMMDEEEFVMWKLTQEDDIHDR